MPNAPDWDRVLILETSGNVGQVALSSGETLVATGHLDRERRRASDLAAICQELLTRHGWPAKTLTAVVVGLGPGSYTALRVGVASAKMLAYATGCAFVGVETFAAYASQVCFPKVTVIADALQGEVYCRSYETDSRGLNPVGDLEIRRLDEWRQHLTPETIVTGPGIRLLKDNLPKLAGEEFQTLQIGSLLNVARQFPWAVNMDMWTAEPYYLRGSSAEEKKRKEGLAV
ncbi:tRNA (adenosine(37)-N6)-threonylcarbamoyltransferase complex dimerization subunit type 1 TsaB [Zavarzinella formosa]|uniref:tRNA (adenosine(37)-N6)-threonylcarbamoyltransferase complex dimerization subunit type 1 TsaB n=1 Tax=Zavarzinella formosa TaxID=360055 RepID=UPI0003130753|nr:tRNA (adenosine(37)-N6)-threonylcarbamoyltransferase complex dimerization subunit type 1 TsaB [Zavarzinella formosa]